MEKAGKIQSRTYALTFVNPPALMPQYGMDKPRAWTRQNIAFRLRVFFPGYAWSAVTEEMTPTTNVRHFHVLAQFNHALNLTKKKIQEVFGWPAYFSMAANIQFVNYFTDDVNRPADAPQLPSTEAPIGPLYDGKTREEVSNELKQAAEGDKPKISDVIVQHLKQGATPDDITKKFPQYMLVNGNKVKQLYSDLKRIEIQAKLDAKRVKFQLLDPDAQETLFQRAIAMHLNMAFDSRNEDNEPELLGRNCHLWVYGRTEIGKSRFLAMIRKMFKCFDWHFSNQSWQDDWDPDVTYDFIIVDEFKTDPKMLYTCGSAFNAMLDGTDKVNQKYKSAAQRMARVPWIITSNNSPYSWFKEELFDTREAIFRRFSIVECTGEITLFKEHWDKVSYSVVHAWTQFEPYTVVRNNLNKKLYTVEFVNMGDKIQKVMTRIEEESVTVVESDNSQEEVMDI